MASSSSVIMLGATSRSPMPPRSGRDMRWCAVLPVRIRPATATLKAYVKSQVVLIYSNAVTVSTTFTPDNNPGSVVTFGLVCSFVPFLPHHDPAWRLVANGAGGATLFAAEGRSGVRHNRVVLCDRSGRSGGV